MPKVKIEISTILISVAAAVLGGVAAGWLTTMFLLPLQFERLVKSMPELQQTVTSTPQAPEVIPVERRPLTPVFPSAFVSRRSSSVLTLVKRSAPAKTIEERQIGPEGEMAGAVALTADGWLATTFGAFGGVRASDAAVVWDGTAYPIRQAIRDTATDAVFIKIEANDLPVAAFVRSEDIVSGAAVWLEPRAKRLYPEIVADVRLRAGIEAVSSERASRRFLISGAGEANWIGGAVWDGSGQLIGLMESKTGEGWRVLPAGDLASALSSLLTTKEIRHPSLGIRTSDLSGLVLEQGRDVLPLAGAWVRTILPQSPAKKLIAEGDVIERVERDILDGAADLGERLLDYRPGAHVTISGRRNGTGVRFETEVVLGSVVTSEVLK